MDKDKEMKEVLKDALQTTEQRGQNKPFIDKPSAWEKFILSFKKLFE